MTWVELLLVTHLDNKKTKQTVEILLTLDIWNQTVEDMPNHVN